MERSGIRFHGAAVAKARTVTPLVARLLANASLAYVPELFMRPSTYFFS
jgi:hypothetical protein